MVIMEYEVFTKQQRPCDQAQHWPNRVVVKDVDHVQTRVYIVHHGAERCSVMINSLLVKRIFRSFEQHL